MPKPTRTRPVSAAQVRGYTNKAQEYAEAAANELESERSEDLQVHSGGPMVEQLIEGNDRNWRLGEMWCQ